MNPPSHKQIFLAGAAIAVIALVVVVCWALGSREPIHQGKKASEWVGDLGTANQQRAGAALHAIGPEKAAPYLVRAIARKETAFDRRYRAFYAKLPLFWQKRLVRPFDFSNYDHRRTVIALELVYYGPLAKPSLPKLAGLLRDSDYWVRFSAAYAMSGLGEDAEPAFPVMLRILDEHPEETTDPFFQVLNQLGPKARPAAPALAKALRVQDPHIRVWAGDSLYQIDPSQADLVRPVMQNSLKEKDPGVRISAASTLWRMDRQPDEIIPALIGLLSESSHPFKYRTVLLLKAMGPGAKPAEPAIARMLLDRDSLTRYAAADTLKLLDPDSAPGLLKQAQSDKALTNSR